MNVYPETGDTMALEMIERADEIPLIIYWLLQMTECETPRGLGRQERKA